MDKVHSAIKSLECVDILQVNVEEDTEVVHSGHGTGTGSVKIEEMDASKNAEPPIHTGPSSERNRKSTRSAASDASTALHVPKTRKKVKTGKDN